MSHAMYGVYPAKVVDVEDPDAQGRVKVSLPWLEVVDGTYEAWARLATLMAGDHRGTWFVPDLGDEVLVAFEQGDPSHPYVLGALWNGVDQPPEVMDGTGSNPVRAICTRSGLRIRFSDEKERPEILIEVPGGGSLTLRRKGPQVELRDHHGNELAFDTQGVSIRCSAALEIEATKVHLSAGNVTVDTGMARFSGVVQCDTLIANSVVASSYTPGAGNIW